MPDIQLKQRFNGGQDKILALLAALGIGVGITTAFSNTILGFMLTALTVISVIILSITGLDRSVLTGQKQVYQATDHQTRLAFWGAVTLFAFTPVLIPQISLGIGFAIIGYLLIVLSEMKDTMLTESEMMKVVYLLLTAGTFFLLYLIPQVILFAIMLPAGMFVWRLVPYHTRERILG